MRKHEIETRGSLETAKLFAGRCLQRQLGLSRVGDDLLQGLPAIPSNSSRRRTLDGALGRNYSAFTQVRLAELANPSKSANVHLRRRALNTVIAKSIDFVICDFLTLDPVAAIEVDARSHLLQRRDRDAFVNAVFAEIGVPLLCVKAQWSYSVAELRDLFARAGVFALPQPEGASL